MKHYKHMNIAVYRSKDTTAITLNTSYFQHTGTVATFSIPAGNSDCNMAIREIASRDFSITWDTFSRYEHQTTI